MKSNPRRRRADRTSRVGKPVSRRSLGWSTRLFLELAEELRQASNLETTLQTVTRISVLLTSSLQGTLRLLDESGKRLLVSARSGPAVHRRGGSSFRLGEGFIGWVAVHRTPSFTNRVVKDPRFVVRSCQAWTPTGIIAVPVLTHRECIGVLSVSRRDKHPYQERDLELLRLVAELSGPHLEIARLKRLNETDPLTLLQNRRYMQERLALEIQRVRRNHRALAMALIDLDHFKEVNDIHGHDVGDQVLTEAAERLRQACRQTDVVSRWGGEEFLVLFPETNLRQATRIAERIRAALGGTPILSSAGAVPVTASLGVVGLSAQEDVRSVVDRADQAMYVAKHRGRNRVVVRLGK